MRLRTVFALFLSTVIAVAAGCGGGGGGGATGTNVSGVASKGPIRGGQVQAFQIFSSHDPNKARLGSAYFTGSTGNDGSYFIPVAAGNTKDSIMVVISGGVYKDEASQADKNLADEYPNGMRAIYPGSAIAASSFKMAVSPFTEMAVRDAGNALDDNSVKASHDKIEHAFGLDNKGVDIVLSQPFDPSAAPPAGADDSRKAYTKALGILSQYESDNSGSGKKMSALSDDLVAEIQGNGGALTAGTSGKLLSSELTYDNSGNDLTGVAPSVAAAVSVSAPSTGVVNTAGVTVSATVTAGAGGSPIANTEVKFAVKSGNGSLAQKSVFTDVNGIASVGLASTVTGSVVVTATAGGVSADDGGTNFITQPTLAIVKVAVNGLPAGKTVGGITADVTYPTNGLTIAAGDVSATGSGVGSLIQPNANVAGDVKLGLINANGMQGGEFATLNFHVAVGTFPQASDFAIAAGASIIDTNSVAIAGASVSVLSVSLQ